MTKILTAFFSMAGQVKAGGRIVHLKKGFTHIAAQFIKDAVGGDLFRIETARPYAEDHFEMLAEAKADWKNGARPALKSFCENFDDYDTVFLGFPNWFGTLPNPVLTFLEHEDWTGKRIVPFVTSGGGGFKHALSALEKSAKGAQIDPNGLELLGTQVEASEDKIKAWAKSRV